MEFENFMREVPAMRIIAGTLCMACDYSAVRVASTKTRALSSLSRVYMAALSFSIIFTFSNSSSAWASSSTCSSMYQLRKLMVA